MYRIQQKMPFSLQDLLRFALWMMNDDHGNDWLTPTQGTLLPLGSNIPTRPSYLSQITYFNLAPVHNAQIEQFKFLRVVCAWTYLKKSLDIFDITYFYSNENNPEENREN